MSTLFDVPMHDFSGEGSMDTDMLPLSAPDVDWLQVENMIEDDVSKQLAAPELEVEMIHETAVQEFEMEDTGHEELPEFIENVSAEHLMIHPLHEPYDQEIPDASRATSPTPVIHSIDPDAHAGAAAATEAVIVLETEEGLHEIDATSQIENVYEESNVYSSHIDHDAPDQQSLQPPISEEVEYPSQEVSDAPQEEYDLHHLEHTEEAHEEEETVAQSAEGDVAALPSENAPQTVETSLHLPEETDLNNEEYYASLDKDTAHEEPGSPSSTQDKTVASEHALQDTSSSLETQLGSQVEGQLEYAASSSHSHVLDDEGKDEAGEPLVEPPPCVLLTYLFDGSHYNLFQSSEKNSGDVTESKLAAAESSVSELEASPSKSEPQSEPQNAQSESRPALLFAEQSDLFYAPLSQVFQAIRGDPSINIGGRFDENIELVITAVGLDLRLPEDNIHSREVSLNDLSVLHTGCELIGPLSLQLDTIAPRFGTRYKAIRDALVSIVSSSDEHEPEHQEHQERIPLTSENQEDPEAHQEPTIQQEPPVSLPSDKINDGSDGSDEKANNVENADAAKETKEVTDNRTSIKAEDPVEPGEDEEAENLYGNENENEGIDHVAHSVVAESYGKSDGVEDEYYDEDAEGEYDEGEQSYESTHGDIDTLYYSENQDENTLLEENPQGDENDAQDTEPEVSAADDNQLQDGLTPEQDASGSEERSLYDEALVPQEGADNIALPSDILSSPHNVLLPRLPSTSTSTKRTFDEHEHGQYEEDGGSPSSTGEGSQKRLRLD